ncbi:response regulator [Variovorax sp. HJSM1_2]|uniref:hybrid sensor histidine kinase/response regulator n=1 Tax=Variovorax sp. HJSM1_2 TaxID=3366263 RepID=UPI003BE36D31
MTSSSASRRGRWRMLVPILTLLAGGLIVLAMGYLQRSQSAAYDASVVKVRDFRVARLDFSLSMLRLGWLDAPQDNGRVVDEIAILRKSLARVSSSLESFGGDPDGMAAAVSTYSNEFLAQLPGQSVNIANLNTEQLEQAYLVLEAAMNRFDSYKAKEVRDLMADQRQQFDIAVGAALVLLAVLGFFVYRDQRRLHLAESSVLENTNQLRQMIEILPQLVWSSDATGACDFLSSRWVAFSGVPTERLMGDGWLQLVHPDEREQMRERWARQVQAGGDFITEYRMRRHDGVYRWFDVRAGMVFDADGRALKWFGTCADVTERKELEVGLTEHRDQLEAQVEQRTAALVSALEERGKAQHKSEELIVQLKAAEDFMRLIADSIPGRIAYWGQDLRCRFVNRGYGQWFGLAEGEILGKSVQELQGPEYFERMRPRVMGALAGEVQDFEREEFNQKGERAVTRVQYLPDWRDGRVEGFIVLATNITSHKRAEEQLQLSNAQLAEARDRADSANRAKSNFLANMSHEIRTPMNAILGLTHMLRRDVDDPTSQTRLTKLSSVAHHLLQIINDILDLSKIESGKLTLEKVDFSLDALLTRTCTMVLDVAREKGLEVVLDTGQLPDRLNGDPTRLMQALLNLLSNAVKFTERGSVLLRGELLASNAEGLTIRFEVRDTGIGIDPEVLPRLFNPFAQADGSSTRRYGGTGLGLTITRHIAELMGGSAGGESLPSRGSRFWISVCLQPAARSEPLGVPVLAGLRSLVVDDLPEARVALVDMLRALGMRADVAENGQQALRMVADAAAEDDAYAVVLMDWAMPGMDGIEAAQHIRAAVQPTPAMVLVSARNQEELQHLADQAGFGAFMLKPVTPSLLLDCMMHLLKKAGHTPPLLRSVESLEAALRDKHRGAHVLLAEDNPVNQEVATELLHAAGLVVDIADDGEQAVRMVRRGTYDLVLMDVQMPRMDGLQATELLRQDPKLADLPIIAMTANAFSEDRQACLDAGMNDHLAKPVDPRILHDALLRWLPVRARLAAPTPSGVLVSAPPEPMSPTEVLATIDGLDLSVTYAQCAGKAELALRVLKQFLAHYRNAGGALMDHLQAGELEDTRRKLHSLRGASGAVGAVSIFEAVEALQAAIKADEAMSVLLPLGETLRERLERLIDSLARRLEA